MRYKNLKYTYNVIGFALVIFIALRESISVIVTNTQLEKNSPMFLLLSMVIFAVACFVPSAVIKNMLGMSPKLFKQVNAKDAAAAAAYGYLVIIGAGILNSMLLGLLEKAGLAFAPAQINVPKGFLPATLYFVYICVMAPILEEIFLRGFVLNALRGWGTAFAVVASAVIFSLMHSSLHNFLHYFICGIVLARVYLAFGSLLPSILLHFVNNTVAFVLAVITQRGNTQLVMDFSLGIYVLAAVLGCIGLWRMQKRNIDLSPGKLKTASLRYKITGLFEGWAALLAMGLLVCISAYQSYMALIK